MEPTTVIELGLSDHQAQVLPELRKNHASVNRRILKQLDVSYVRFVTGWTE